MNYFLCKYCILYIFSGPSFVNISWIISHFSMTTGSFTRSDLNQIHNVVQNTHTNVVKDIIIGILRDEFSKDSYYHFVRDQYGFPYTPDLTNKPLGAGYSDD